MSCIQQYSETFSARDCQHELLMLAHPHQVQTEVRQWIMMETCFQRSIGEEKATSQTSGKHRVTLSWEFLFPIRGEKSCIPQKRIIQTRTFDKSVFETAVETSCAQALCP